MGQINGEPTQTLTGPIDVGHHYTPTVDGSRDLTVWIQLGDRRYSFDGFDDALAVVHDMFRRLGTLRLKVEA